MQSLTAAPREAWSADEVRAMLNAPDLHVRGGCDLLDLNNRFVRDISGEMSLVETDTGEQVMDGSVTWDANREVHRTCSLSLLSEFDWLRDRFRPWVELSSALVRGGEWARFHLGVFTLTSPNDQRGEDPQTWECSGSDNIWPLQNAGPGDTYVALSGVTYLDAIRAVLTASGIGGQLLLDGTQQTTALPATRVWCLSASTDPTWLDIINDLLREINYVPLFADENGTYRSRPHKPVEDRAAEWVFDTDDEATDIIDGRRSVQTEGYDLTNVWRFVNRTHGVTEATPDGITPTTGNGGIYVVDEYDADVHPWRVVKMDFLDAADADALEAQGDAIVAADKARTTQVELEVDPLPIAGHGDVVTFTDLGQSLKLPVAHWSVSLDGARTAWTLGGSPPEVPQPVEAATKATITDDAPLRVVVDGAETDSLANALDAATYTLGQRVTVTVRNPLPPLIQGVES